MTRTPKRFDPSQPRDEDGKWTRGIQRLANVLRDNFGDLARGVVFDNGGNVDWSSRGSDRYTFSFEDADGGEQLTVDLNDGEMLGLANAVAQSALHDYGPKLDENDLTSVNVYALAANEPGGYYTNDDDLGSRYFDWSSRDGDTRTLEVGNADDETITLDMSESDLETLFGQLTLTLLQDNHGVTPTESDEENAGEPAVKISRARVRTQPRQARAADAAADLTIVRTTLLPCEFRAEETKEERAGLGLMDVRFSPFETWYRVSSWWEGDFMERTVKGAFKRTFAAHRAATNVDAHNIKTMFNHGMDMYVDQKLLGDIDDIAEDKDSARSTVWLWDTSYNRDLLPGLRSGAYGSSFMFRIVKEEWDEEPGKSSHNPDGIPERTIREARVFEAGPVTWPASPTASAGMRCLSATDQYYDHLARRDPKRVDGMRAQRIALRDAGLIPGLAAATPDDSRQAHSTGITARERRERIYPYLKGAQS